MGQGVAHVIHPVTIEGFLAQVQPGTRFEVEKAPVEGDIWLVTHYSMRASAKILFIVPQHASRVKSLNRRAVSFRTLLECMAIIGSRRHRRTMPKRMLLTPTIIRLSRFRHRERNRVRVARCSLPIPRD